jgi:hypothetical protein
MGTSDGPRLRPAFNLSSEAAARVSLSKADAPLLDQRDGPKWNPKIQSQADRGAHQFGWVTTRSRAVRSTRDRSDSLGK